MRNVVALRDLAKRLLALLPPLDRFLALMLGEFGLAAELDATVFRIGAAERRALLDPPTLKLGRYAEHGKDQFGKVRRCVHDRLGERAKAHAGLLQVAGDHKQVGHVA